MAALIPSISVDRSSVESGQTVFVTCTLTQPATATQAWTIASIQPIVTPSTSCTIGLPLPLPQTVPLTNSASTGVGFRVQFYAGSGSLSRTSGFPFSIGFTATMSDGTMVSAPAGCGATVYAARSNEYGEPPLVLPTPGTLIFDSNQLSGSSVLFQLGH